MELPSLSAPVDAPGAGRDVAVIGGGAVGATVAYDLARRDASVTLVEAGAIGGGATYRAAGICHDAFTDPTEAAVAGEAIDRLRRLSGDDTFAFSECPYVWFAHEGDDDGVERVTDGVRRMQEQGVIALEADREALAERFPDLVVDDVAIAGIAGAAGYVDPVRYTACLAAAASGAGATLVTETTASVSLDPLRVEAGGEVLAVDDVVVAAGAWTGEVLGGAGLELPVRPYGVQAGLWDCNAVDAMWYDCTERLYARPHPDGVVAGDGVTAVAGPDDHPPVDDAVSARLATLLGTRLDADPEAHREWTGLCTATPDGLPLVGEIADAVYVATGFDGQGLCRAPAVAERLADQVLGGPGLEAYDPRRVPADAPIELEGTGPP